jgi:hypothetical protein
VEEVEEVPSSEEYVEYSSSIEEEVYYTETQPAHSTVYVRNTNTATSIINKSRVPSSPVVSSPVVSSPAVSSPVVSSSEEYVYEEVVEEGTPEELEYTEYYTESEEEVYYTSSLPKHSTTYKYHSSNNVGPSSHQVVSNTAFRAIKSAHQK